MDAAGRLEESGYPIRRAYDFHVIVLKSATQMGLPQMALGATAMMAAVSQAAGTRIFEMIAYSQAAQLELILGNPDEAARKYDLARRLFGTFGESSEANVYWRVTQAGWLEAHRNREELYRILKEAKGQNPSGRDELYFTRKIVASLCRLELRAGHEDAVEALAVPFLNTAASVGKAQPGAIRAYLPEIETTATSLTTALLKAGRPEEALAAWHRFVGVRERLMGGGERVARPTRLEPGTAVLTVADLGGGAALWLTTSKSVEFTWAGSGYRHLIERIRLLSRLSRMDSAPESRIAKEARGIFAVLFPSGVKGISAVGVESSGEFNTLPLALFSYSDEGKNIAYSFLPFGGAVSAANRNADHITTVAATTFDHELTRGGEIAGSVDDEVESIAAKFVKRESIRGRAATARALDAAAGHDGVLHFAGHAIPWHGRVGLMVTPDARDSDADGRAGIWAMPRTKRMKSELVVFSACATGGFEDPGTIRPGQLTEAALLAGAGEAVATLWPVNSEATMAYMNLFYAHYVAGETVAAALRSASLEMRSTNRWKHPRYWAPFAVYSRLSGGITTNN